MEGTSPGCSCCGQARKAMADTERERAGQEGVQRRQQKGKQQQEQPGRFRGAPGGAAGQDQPLLPTAAQGPLQWVPVMEKCSCDNPRPGMCLRGGRGQGWPGRLCAAPHPAAGPVSAPGSPGSPNPSSQCGVGGGQG